MGLRVRTRTPGGGSRALARNRGAYVVQQALAEDAPAFALTSADDGPD